MKTKYSDLSFPKELSLPDFVQKYTFVLFADGTM